MPTVKATCLAGSSDNSSLGYWLATMFTLGGSPGLLPLPIKLGTDEAAPPTSCTYTYIIAILTHVNYLTKRVFYLIKIIPEFVSAWFDALLENNLLDLPPSKMIIPNRK